MGLSTFEQFKHVENSNLIFLNDAQLKDLHNVLLMMADDVITYCDTYNINYNLSGGTALGAIRHHGFIPWDDDFDINMPRPDYENFISGFVKIHSDKYEIECPERTKNYRAWGARVRLRGTVLKDREDLQPGQHGVWIDIFPVESTYDNRLLRFFHGVICMIFGFICSCTRTRQDLDYYLNLASGNKKLTRALLVKSWIGFFFSFRKFSSWLMTSVQWYARCKNNNSKYVVIPSGRKHFFGETYLRADFVPVRKENFEGRSWNVSVHVEKYLTKLYGDWSIIPGERDREHHAFLEYDLGKYNFENFNNRY